MHRFLLVSQFVQNCLKFCEKWKVIVQNDKKANKHKTDKQTPTLPLKKLSLAALPK